MTFRRVRAMPTVGALTLLFLAGAGCLHHKEAVTPVSTIPTGANKVNLEGIVEVVPVEIHKKQAATHGGSCAVDLVYPSLHNSPFVDANNDFQNEVFTFLHHQLGSEENFTSDDAVDQEADQYISNCLTQLDARAQAGAVPDTSEDAPDVAADPLDQYVHADFTVTLNEFHMLSVSLEGSSSDTTQGKSEKFVNVDLGGNRLITLGDVLVDQNLKTFFQHEKQKLLDEQKNALNPSSVDEFQTFIADTSEMSVEEQHDVYGKFENFYLTPTSIVTVYNNYEIAPASAGPIHVEMNFDELADFIDHSEPFYPVVENAQGKN